MPTPLDVVRAVYAAFSAGDGAEFLSYIDPQCAWMYHGPASVPYAGLHRGPSGVGEFLGKVIASEKIEVFNARDYYPAGDTILVRGDETVVAIKTGRRFSVPWLHIWRVSAAGKVTAFEMFTDTAAVAAAHTA